MFLVRTNFVENSHIYARKIFILLKTVLNETSNEFNTKFQRQWTARKSTYRVNQASALF